MASRDCQHCLIWQYSEKTGKVEYHHGQPQKRVKGVPAPCRGKFGCPKGTPEKQKSLSIINREVWEHYKRCEATGQWPDDELVREHAAMLKAEVKAHRDLQQIQLFSSLVPSYPGA